MRARSSASAPAARRIIGSSASGPSWSAAACSRDRGRGSRTAGTARSSTIRSARSRSAAARCACARDLSARRRSATPSSARTRRSTRRADRRSSSAASAAHGAARRRWSSFPDSARADDAPRAPHSDPAPHASRFRGVRLRRGARLCVRSRGDALHVLRAAHGSRDARVSRPDAADGTPRRTGSAHGHNAVLGDAWGLGYATEGACALVRAGFDQLGVARIFATCDVANRASARVLEKAGLRREATLNRHKHAKDRWWTSFLYAVRRAEWIDSNVGHGLPPAD